MRFFCLRILSPQTMQTVFGEERHRYRKCGLRKFSQANNWSSLSASYISSARFWMYSHCVLLREKKKWREKTAFHRSHSILSCVVSLKHHTHFMEWCRESFRQFPVDLCGCVGIQRGVMRRWLYSPWRPSQKSERVRRTAFPIGFLPPLPTWPWGLNQEGPKPKRREPSQVESHIRGYISTAVVSSSSSQSKVF